MSEFDDMASRDERTREPKAEEYTIPAVIGGGQIVCVTPGVRLIDFYRTSSVLAKDVPPAENMRNQQ